ncbi:MAG: recombinase family protein [Geminicoccaceae bacterium]
MLVGYMRVSSADERQSVDLQRDATRRDALRRAGAEERQLFVDKASGARDDRPGLQAYLAYLKAGDVLVVWKLDRLGRSLPHRLAIVADLKARVVVPPPCSQVVTKRAIPSRYRDRLARESCWPNGLASTSLCSAAWQSLWVAMLLAKSRLRSSPVLGATPGAFPRRLASLINLAGLCARSFFRSRPYSGRLPSARHVGDRSSAYDAAVS